MKATHVGLCMTEAARAAERPALTPELLAACGARYSRNNEGLEAILARVDPANLDRSVDSIFRMIDYGHQSIADMVPVAIFIDGVSLWLAYYLWTLCPVSGGQESSTRYLRLAPEDLPDSESFGIDGALREEWHAAMSTAFSAYAASLQYWENIAMENPSITRIPKVVLEDDSESGKRKAARMRRNYAFDRARYYIPVAARTNVMLVMSARAWVTVCDALFSHPLEEARKLADILRSELGLCAPRLLKHACAKPATQKGLADEFESLAKTAAEPCPWLADDSKDACPSSVAVSIDKPNDISDEDITTAFLHHDNRYAWIAQAARRVVVRFAWDAVTMGEIRDLNRHRTGNKYCPLVPVGFYGACDQVPKGGDAAAVHDLFETGRRLSARARELLAAGNPAYIYWSLLGTQYPFEHVTTADKFIYEAELRTGTGAHYQYALHLNDALEEWFKTFPATRTLIRPGQAEPE